tara:strand:+ start:112 stop:234 length:123 start_codon:yes stop_codon:yes gene_type:complete
MSLDFNDDGEVVFKNIKIIELKEVEQLLDFRSEGNTVFDY